MVKKLRIRESYGESKPIKFYYRGKLIFEGDKYDLWDVKDKFISICQHDNGLTDSIIEYCNSFGDPLLDYSETDLREIVGTFFEVVIAEANDYEYDDNELYIDGIKDVEIFTESKSMCEAGRMVNGRVSELSTQFDSRKSFGGKAKVVTDSDGTQILYSYNTPVVELEKGKKVKLLPQWDSSATTLRHVREFLLQNGFEAGSKAQIAKLYSDMTESKLRIKESDMIKFGSRDEDLDSLEYALEKYVGKPVAKAQQYLRDLGFDMFVMAGPSKRDETWEEYTTDKDNSGSVSVKLYFDLDSDPKNPRRKTNGKLTDFFVDRYN